MNELSAIEIRVERAEDIRAIRKVNIAAFKRSHEANLVDQLRGVAATLSFVAVKNEKIVGHIFYSPVEILPGDRAATKGECAHDLWMLGLAPVAVLPEYQRQGIGSLLIRQSLAVCGQLGGKAVVVLGSPAYYLKFGFVPAKEKGLRCEYSVPEEAFMVFEWVDGALAGCNGIVKYRSEFRTVEEC